MQSRTGTLRYSILQALLWGEFGLLISFANPWLTERIGLSDTAAGIVLALAMGLALLMQPILTGLVDRSPLSSRHVLMLSALCCAVCCMAAPLCSGWVSIMLFGLACVCIQTQPSFSNALAMQSIRGGLDINFGLSRGCGSASFAVCCLIEPMLNNFFGMDTIPYATAVFAVLLCMATWRMPEAKKAMNAAEEAPTPIREFFRTHQRFALLLIAATLLYTAQNALGNFMFRVVQMKLPSGTGSEVLSVQGTALMIAGFAELPCMFLFMRMVKRVRCDIWMCLSAAFIVLRVFLALILPDVWGLYLAQLTQGLGYSLFAVSSVYYVGYVIEKRNVVKGQTYLGATNTLGNLIAYLLGGMLIDTIGTSGMLVTCIALSAVGVCLMLLSTEKVEKTAVTNL